MNEELIHLKLIADPFQFSMTECYDFKIGIVATNLGNEVINPELHCVKLFINDKESRVWSLAIGNGKREAKWFALPPGDTVSMNWSSMGASFFPAPGEYTLILRLGNKETSPIVVRLLP